MAAFSARMFVCSAMSLISSTIEPISCELSPRRLIRFEVSWIWSRMESMPWIVWRTTSAPFAAICTERCATSADSAEFFDTSSIDDRDLVDLRRRRGDLLRLVFGGFREVHRGRLRFLGGGGHLHGGLVDRALPGIAALRPRS